MGRPADQIEAVFILLLVVLGVAVLAVLVEASYIRAQEEGPEQPSGQGRLSGDAPTLVARLASMKEQDRRSGIGHMPDTTERVETGRPSPVRSLQVSFTRSGFVIEAREKLPPGAWVRLAVDRAAGRFTATCGGAPTVYCTDGRWRVESFGTDESYLLGR